MKMLGFMITLTLIYWAMANYSQSVLAGGGDCVNSLALSAEKDSASRAGEMAASPQTVFGGAEAAQEMQFENQRAAVICR